MTIICIRNRNSLSLKTRIIINNTGQLVILVTGGTGFVGSTLIKYLINEGKAVLATKRPGSNIPKYLLSSSLIQWVDADVTDYFALENIFSNVTQVYHCAAKVSYQKNDIDEMNATNIEGTKHIVNLCLAYGARLVHVSSIAALGTNKQGAPVNEKDKWEFDNRISKYSLSKYKSELEVWRGIMEGLDAIIVNPSLIIGIGTQGKGSGIIFNLVNRGLKVYPSGSVGIVDVEDVAKTMIQLMNTPQISGERFILNSQNYSHKDLLSSIARLLNREAPSVEATPFLLGIGWRAAKLLSLFNRKPPTLTQDSARVSSSRLQYDNTKVVNTLGYTFKPVEETLQQIVETEYKQILN